MNMPGFTAEVSLYKTSKSYAVAADLQAIPLSTTVYPQMRRATGPYGSIGFPGKDCFRACFHICMSWGKGDFGECWTECESNCGDPSFNASAMI